MEGVQCAARPSNESKGLSSHQGCPPHPRPTPKDSHQPQLHTEADSAETP